MTDAFLAEVLTFNPITSEASVLPLIMESDGTPHPPINTKAVAGIMPNPGDLVLVVTLRNNLDNGYVSRFFDASESNGRIVHVVRSIDGVYAFFGDYKITGSLEIQGSLSVTGNMDVTGPASIDGALSVTGAMSVDGVTTLGAVVFDGHGHICTTPGSRGGPPIT